MMTDNDKTRLPEEGSKESLLSSGQIFGQYKIIRLLGRGGMGEVYEVEHSVLHKSYALKVIRPEMLSRPSAVERFRREAQVMSHLEHPNVVQVDEFGETDGHTWLRMPLIGDGVAGESSEFNSLGDMIVGDPLPESLVVDLIGQVLDGLAYAHSKGAIHRDIKPSNILLEPNSRKSNTYTPKIADFGLVHMAGEDWVQSQVQLTVAQSMAQPADPDATRLEDGSPSSNGTSTQAMLGTYEFMAPEQKRGQPADARSDLYAVGLMAFRMLTGQELPGFELPSEIVPSLDPEWDVWFKSALAQQAGRRFESADAMASSMPSAKTDVAEIRGAQWEEDIPGPEIAPGGDEVIESVDREEAEHPDATHSEVKPSENLQAYHDQDSEVGTAGKEADIVHEEATSKRSFPLAWLIIVCIPIPGFLVAYFFSGNGGAVEKPEVVSQVVSQADSVQHPEVDPPAEKAIKVTGPESGRDWTVDLGGGERMKLKWIASGSFQMGSPSGEIGRDDDERQHRVTLSKGYWLGEHEVTQGEWQAVMGSNPSYIKGSNLPVDEVSWEDAMEFCRKLTARERAAGRLAVDYSYTLPTEAQWEYACRAGTTGAYAGDLDAMSWYDKNSGTQPHPVGQKRANAWGLYDMHGNVLEWCSDWYGSYPSGSMANPKGANSGSNRVYRGGCWRYAARHCRSASRYWNFPGYRGNNLGFRLALSSTH